MKLEERCEAEKVVKVITCKLTDRVCDYIGRKSECDYYKNYVRKNDPKKM